MNLVFHWANNIECVGAAKEKHELHHHLILHKRIVSNNNFIIFHYFLECLHIHNFPDYSASHLCLCFSHGRHILRCPWICICMKWCLIFLRCVEKFFAFKSSYCCLPTVSPGYDMDEFAEITPTKDSFSSGDHAMFNIHPDNQLIDEKRKY